MNNLKLKIVSGSLDFIATFSIVSVSILRSNYFASIYDSTEIMSKSNIFVDTKLLAFVILIMLLVSSILKNIVYEVNKEEPKFTSKFRKLSIDILLFSVSIIVLLANINPYSEIVLISFVLYYILLLNIEMFIPIKYFLKKDATKKSK